VFPKCLIAWISRKRENVPAELVLAIYRDPIIPTWMIPMDALEVICMDLHLSRRQRTLETTRSLEMDLLVALRWAILKETMATGQ